MREIHKFVGILPAGISAQNKLEPREECALFLDPWRAQKPRILTLSEEEGSIVTALGVSGGFLKFAISSPYGACILWGVGTACLYYRGVEGLDDYIKKLFSAVMGYVRFDYDHRDIIDIPSENNQFAMPHVMELLRVKQNIDDPQCPELWLLKLYNPKDFGELFDRYLGRSVRLHLACPVGIKIRAPNDVEFRYDPVNNSFLGNLPVLANSVVDQDGSRILDLVVTEKSFEVEITASEKGIFNFCLIDEKKRKIAFYENVKINQNDIYNLKFIRNQTFNVLEGPSGVKIIPTVMHFSMATPWIHLLLE